MASVNDSVDTNIFQIKRITNAQTINTNRFTIRFKDLQTKIITNIATGTLGDLRPDLKALYERVAGSLEWDSDEIAVDPATTLELSLFSATIPNVQVETQALARFNDSIRAVTKFAEMEDLTCSFYDYVNGSASAILLLWQYLVGNKKTGAIGFKQDFVLPEAEFYVYGPDVSGLDPAGTALENTDETSIYHNLPYVQRYRLLNLFPRQINLGEHTMDGGEARKVEATFNVDNVYLEETMIYDYNSHAYKLASDAVAGAAG